MIVYNRFRATLHTSGESTYTLLNRHHISSSTSDKLRKKKPITTTTLNDRYCILQCHPENILEYIPSKDHQLL